MTVKSGFEHNTLNIEIRNILPVRAFPHSCSNSTKYSQIKASIHHIGLVELPVVCRSNLKNKFMLLDGHWRLEALKDLCWKSVHCLVSTSDEAYTYNTHVNRLTNVQEHMMIKRAIEKGLSEERIAEVLDLKPRLIEEQRDLLVGICEDVVSLLKDQPVPKGTFDLLRRVRKNRQIEMAELMSASKNFTKNYATALIAATPSTQIRGQGKPHVAKSINAPVQKRMGSELKRVRRKLKVAQEGLGHELMKNAALKAYGAQLMDNAKVVGFLAKYKPHALMQIQKIVSGEDHV